MDSAHIPRAVFALAIAALILVPAVRVWTQEVPWTPSATMVDMDEVALAHPADLVVVGPSLARTDVDPRRLGAALASPPLSSARFAQNLASGPAWYAMLKYRVYANGLRPRVIALVATMDYLLETRPPGKRMSALEEHFAEPDAVLAAKTWNTRLPALLQRALDQRTRLKDPFVNAFRDGAVGLLVEGAGAPADRVAAAGEALFGQEHGGTQARLLPVVEHAVVGAVGGATRVSDPMLSYLPDIAALVAAHGGRLVLVLPPMAPSVASEHAVTPTEDRAILLTANALRVGVVDLRAMPLDEFAYTDGYHLAPEARVAFTDALGAAMVELNVLGTGPMRPAWSAPVPTVERFGEPPRLPVSEAAPGEDACLVDLQVDDLSALADDALRNLAGHLVSPLRVREGSVALAHASRPPRACGEGFFHAGGRLRVARSAPGSVPIRAEWNPDLPILDEEGEGTWWVWPGGGIRFRWSEGLPLGPVEVSAVVVDPSGGGATLGGAPFVGDGGVLRSSVVRDSDGSLVVEVASPQAVALRELRIMSGDQIFYAVRPPAPNLSDLFPGAITAPPPPPLDSPALVRRFGRAALPAPWADSIGCSPLRVAEDGVELPSGAIAAGTTNKPSGKVVDHVDGNVFVVATDTTDPSTNGRAYTLQFSQERACRRVWKRKSQGRVWLYPGDVVESDITPAAASGPLRGVRLKIESNGVVAPEAVLRIELQVGDSVRLDQTLPLQTLLDVQDLDLAAPLNRDPFRVRVTLSGSDTPVLLTAAGLEG